MYIKVYYKNNKNAVIDEVKDALPQDMQGLIVDDGLGYPCVEFPKGATNADWVKVQQHLQSQGFETED